MKTDQSHTLFVKAQQLIPGGVNSPVRACKSVGCEPLFVKKAAGSKIHDVDGNEFLDFVCSWGPMILGHNHPAVVEAIEKTLRDGTSFGAPCPLEIELAELVINALPSVEKVRFVSSGTEATMSAIRLARGYTGRKVVVKFDGCYHGHADSFLVKAGSGVITLGIPGSPGVPEDIVKNTVSIPYNNSEILEKTLRDEKLDIACVIIEAVAGNMGVVAPQPGFLQKLRALTAELGIVLIFDEVITGLRSGLGRSAGILWGHAGSHLSGQDHRRWPAGWSLWRQKGTHGHDLSGRSGVSGRNPVRQSPGHGGGAATMRQLAQPGFYAALEEKSARFAQGLTGLAEKYLPGQTTLNRVGSMMTVFFTAGPVVDFDSAMQADTARYGQHFRQMLAQGIWLAPSQFEAAFISAAQSEAELAMALEKTECSFKKLAE